MSTAVGEMPEDVGPEWVQMEIWHRYRAELLEQEIDQAKRLVRFFRNQHANKPDTWVSYLIELHERQVAMYGGWLREEQAGQERAKREREKQYRENGILETDS